MAFFLPGGFITGPSAVEELIILDPPTDSLVHSVLAHLEAMDEIESVCLLERTPDKAFIYFRSIRVPQAFCSQVVQKNPWFQDRFRNPTQRPGNLAGGLRRTGPC